MLARGSPEHSFSVIDAEPSLPTTKTKTEKETGVNLNDSLREFDSGDSGLGLDVVWTLRLGVVSVGEE